ncbi:MAG: TolC family protein [Bacillota bacterium]|nr:TolC family protein [Bacillota bacterium]MDW7685202.1 TolC family protein [Bacillota bacterium]
MRKKRLILLMAAILIVTAGFATAVGTLTLPQAIQMAQSENPDAERSDLVVRRAELGYDQVQSAVYDLQNIYNQTGSLPLNEFKMLHLGPLEAEQALVLAQQARKMTQNRLALEAWQSYIGLLKARKNLRLAEMSLDRAREMKRLAEAALEAGTVAKSDVLGAEAQVAQEEARLYAAENTANTAELTLNMTTGRQLLLPADVSEVELPTIGEVHLQDGLTQALANRLEIIDARGKLFLKEKAFNLAKSYFQDQDIFYREAELELAEARLNMDETEQNIRFQVHQLHNSFLVLEKQLAALEQSVTYAAESYRLASLRYEAGIGTQVDVLTARVTLSELESQLLNAKYDHYLTYLQWLLAIGRAVE